MQRVRRSVEPTVGARWVGDSLATFLAMYGCLDF